MNERYRWPKIKETRRKDVFLTSDGGVMLAIFGRILALYPGETHIFTGLVPREQLSHRLGTLKPRPEARIGRKKIRSQLKVPAVTDELRQRDLCCLKGGL